MEELGIRNWSFDFYEIYLFGTSFPIMGWIHRDQTNPLVHWHHHFSQLLCTTWLCFLDWLFGEYRLKRLLGFGKQTLLCQMWSLDGLLRSFSFYLVDKQTVGSGEGDLDWFGFWIEITLKWFPFYLVVRSWNEITLNFGLHSGLVWMCLKSLSQYHLLCLLRCRKFCSDVWIFQWNIAAELKLFV